MQPGSNSKNLLEKNKKALGKIWCLEAEHAYYLNISEDHIKTSIRCYELSFLRHILQAMYIFVYEKINQNKVLSGSTQYSKREIFVLSLEKLAS